MSFFSRCTTFLCRQPLFPHSFSYSLLLRLRYLCYICKQCLASLTHFFLCFLSHLSVLGHIVQISEDHSKEKVRLCPPTSIYIYNVHTHTNILTNTHMHKKFHTKTQLNRPCRLSIILSQLVVCNTQYCNYAQNTIHIISILD